MIGINVDADRSSTILKKTFFRLPLNPTKYLDASYSLSSVVFSFSKLALVDFNMLSRPTNFFAAILQNFGTNFSSKIVPVDNGMVAS